MSRARVIVIATLVAMVGVALPIGATLYLSWQRAVQAQEKNLQVQANFALERTRLTLLDANKVLHAFDNLSVEPCSPAHMRQMRLLLINTISIAEIGYFKNGVLECNSAELASHLVTLTPTDFKFENGVEINLHITPDVSAGKRMIGLYIDPYKILIDPSRFVDVLVDRDIQLAIGLSDGRLIATLNKPEPELASALLRQADNIPKHDYLYGVARDGELSAVAMESRANVMAQLQNEQMWLLPLGVLLSGLLLALVLWISKRRLSTLGELKIAVQRREFIVHYQPIIALKTGLCIGAEALVRWQRPDGDMVGPDAFIPLAEESGLIMPITDQVIETVIHDLKEMLIEDRSLHVSINLCSDDIKTGRILDVLKKVLHESGIEASQISLEATERGFLNIDAARATIGAARAQGHSISIDDFGTGYSSLSYLQGFPLDELKIDKSFVDMIGIDAATSSVTPHIISMAKTLQLTIVAEGIETQEQADYLRDHQVEFGQGWLFSKALTRQEFIDFCHENKLRIASENKS